MSVKACKGSKKLLLLTLNNCTKPSFRQTKSYPGRVLCTVLVTIPCVGPPSLSKFHSIDKKGPNIELNLTVTNERLLTSMKYTCRVDVDVKY